MLLFAVMRRFFRYGRLTLIDAAGNRRLVCNREGPAVSIRIADPAIERRLLFGGSLTWGEAWMDGKLRLEQGSLADFIEIYYRSARTDVRGWLAAWRNRLELAASAARHFNPLGRARRNVAHHYDLSDELYASFLDPDRQYSCAYFHSDNEDLETAQLAKKRHIAAKLALEPGMRVLDIGSGWGGLALYLASHFDCRVSGITLSVEQLEYARRRARDAGLDGRVEFELRDYRRQDGRYDRIVTVGMLEHVGPCHYGVFFRRLRGLLAPGGVALVHSIARMDGPRPPDPWLDKYIFPGGYLPALSQLARAIEHEGLWLTDLENLRRHYAETLQRWHWRFAGNRQRVAEIYGERFCRMWELYLLGCEAVFRHGQVGVLQLQLCRDAHSLPLTRDYMGETEQALAARDGSRTDRDSRARGGRKRAGRDLETA